MTVSVPSVPGKTQRVLINKRQAAKATSTAARLFKKPLVQAGHETSTTGSSTQFSSFISSSKSKSIAPFGSKDLRFNGKLELMEYFNKDPGPGAYEEFDSTVQAQLESGMKKLVGLKNVPID
jgi:hypothetical protein